MRGLCLFLAAGVVAGQDAPRAVEKSLALLQSSGPPFVDKSGCISCHHQSIAAMAVAVARQRGLKVSDSIARQQLKFTAAVFSPHRTNLLQGINTVPEAPMVSSYALLGMAAEGYPADAVTDAMVLDLARKQRGDGSWRNNDRRVPLGYSDFSATALSLEALRLYSIPGRRQEFDERVAHARRWLLAANPGSTEEQAFRLLGLGWSKAPPADVRKAVVQLAVGQRGDGGWAQLASLTSDAYATGQALVALYQGGAMPASDAVYARGVRYLLGAQLPDGSWHVRSRAMGFQPYFESGFPHGQDQWISAAATSWAAMALALTLPGR